MSTVNMTSSTSQSIDIGFNKINRLYCACSKERHLPTTISNPTVFENAIKFDATWEPVWVDAYEISGEGVPYLYEALHLRGGFQKDTRWSRRLNLREKETEELFPVRVLRSKVIEVDGCIKDCFLVSFMDSKVDLQDLHGHWLEYGRKLAMSQLGKAVLLSDEVGVRALNTEAQNPTATNTCHSAGTRKSRLALAGHKPLYEEQPSSTSEQRHCSSEIILSDQRLPMEVKQTSRRSLTQEGQDRHRDDGDKDDSLPQDYAPSYGDQETSHLSDDRLAGKGGTEATQNQCHENDNNRGNGMKLETILVHRAGASFGFYEYEKLTDVHMGKKGTLATVKVHWRPSSVSLQDLPRTALPEVRETFLKMYSEKEWDDQMETLQGPSRPSKRRRLGAS